MSKGGLLSKRCQKLWDDLDLGLVTVLKFDAEMIADDDVPAEEDVERAPITPLVFAHEDHIVVLLDTRIRTEGVRIHTVMYAPFSKDDGDQIDVDPTDEELLQEFAGWAAKRVLVPRTEALASTAAGLIGPMTRLPTDYLGDAKVAMHDMDEDREAHK